jgi:hypothetical protein
MKYIFIFLLAAFAFYEYIFYIPDYTDTTKYPTPAYNEAIDKTNTELPTEKNILPVRKVIPPKPIRQFKCDGRQHCSQMHSYEEAKFFLRNCPKVKMDGDRDGIPCERQFGRYD